MMVVGGASEGSVSDQVCPECGAAVEGGRAGCQALFEEMLALHYGNPVLFRVHGISVDAYALQHPDKYCRSVKSLAAHLGGLCVFFEHDNSPVLDKALQRWLNGTLDAEKPEHLPTFRGTVTINDVLASSHAPGHVEMVQKWAAAAWEAWAEHHQLAGQWVGLAGGWAG